jgi:2-iminobutanoate/2-iminopropanoate deaminase
MSTRPTHFDLPDDGAGSPYSQAVRDGDLLGQLASDDPSWAGPNGHIEAETQAVMDRIGRILALAGAGHDDIIRVGIYMTDLSGFDRMNAVYRGYFQGCPPARTTVGVAALLNGGMIEIDCVARLPTLRSAPLSQRGYPTDLRRSTETDPSHA